MSAPSPAGGSPAGRAGDGAAETGGAGGVAAAEPDWPAILDSAPVEEEAPVTPEETERGLLARLVGGAPTPTLGGWLGPLLVAGLALVLRLVHLARPHVLVFDETYYVKQAYSLLRLGYEARWSDGANELFAAGDPSALLTAAEYVVHPPLGKWLIAFGIHALGQDSAAGWRLAGALAGALTVLLVARIGRRLLGSTLLGCTAGLLLAVDGNHLVLSRTGILDVFLALFTVAAFGAVVLDRHASRTRLARAATTGGVDAWGPGLGVRWWLVAAGVLCGLAIGIKWSGLWVLATLGILTVVWSVTARRAVGTRLWVGAGLLRDGVPAFLCLVPVAAATYVAGWASWFAHPGAYLRQWAAENPASADARIPDALESWWEYHRMVWQFHTTLDTPHAYEASARGWLVQWRPTSFFWEDAPDGVACGAERCVQAITSVGNPVLWWAGLAALVVVGYGAVRLRDWRAWTVLAGYAATWLPWLAFPERTTFTFYAVVLVPFVALAAAYLVGMLLGWRPATAGGPDRLLVARERWREPGPWVAAAFVVLVLVVSWFFWPVWTAQAIPYEAWRLRMWMPSWI